MTGDKERFTIDTLRADLFGVLFKIFNKNPRPYYMRVVPQEGKLCQDVIFKRDKKTIPLS